MYDSPGVMHHLPCERLQQHRQRWAPSATTSRRRHVRIAITLHFSTLYPETRPIISITIVYNNDIDLQERAEMAASFLFYASLLRRRRCGRWRVTRTWRITTHPCRCRRFVRYHSTIYCYRVRREWSQALSVVIVKDWDGNMGGRELRGERHGPRWNGLRTWQKCNIYPQNYYTTMHSWLII